MNPVEENHCVHYELSKNKFRNMYLKKTGEFLKISQKLESQLFSKIVSGLSQSHQVSEKLVDAYLDWSFENSEFFIKKYSAFNLMNIANFSEHWNIHLFKSSNSLTQKFNQLDDVNVSESIFKYCEKYGIPWVATKLAQEKNVSPDLIKKIMNEKLSLLTKDIREFDKLRNMLRKTVENAPYDADIIFNNYKNDLRHLFDNFAGEPWF
jgi:hypothetical protein